MNRLLSSVAAVGSVIIVSCMGCTVKEDRSVCPCVLVLDFSRVDSVRSDSLHVSVLSADGFCHGAVVQNGDYGQLYSVNVPRSGVQVNVCSVLSGEKDFSYMLSADASSLTIPPGEECPAVNMFSKAVDTEAEIITLPVTLHKNYCTLSIRLVSEQARAFSFRLQGRVCGYGSDGSPAEGDFSFSPRLDDRGTCSVRIPRQKDSSLRLLILDEAGVLREFAVGEYIVESGYDWQAEDLEDVEIVIDYAKADVTFLVNGWETAYDMQVEI